MNYFSKYVLLLFFLCHKPTSLTSVLEVLPRNSRIMLQQNNPWFFPLHHERFLLPSKLSYKNNNLCKTQVGIEQILWREILPPNLTVSIQIISHSWWLLLLLLIYDLHNFQLCITNRLTTNLANLSNTNKYPWN